MEPGDERQDGRRLAIHNVYNPPKTVSNRRSILPHVRGALEDFQANEQILLGDNLHHSLWGESRVEVTDSESEDLIDIIGQFTLHSPLLPGTITYEEGRSQTAIDLCLTTIGLVDRIVRSEADRDLDHDSDHLPIVTVIDLIVQRLGRTPKKNWKRLNEAYTKTLENVLPPLRRPSTKTALDAYVKEVTTAI